MRTPASIGLVTTCLSLVAFDELADRRGLDCGSACFPFSGGKTLTEEIRSSKQFGQGDLRYELPVDPGCYPSAEFLAQLPANVFWIDERDSSAFNGTIGVIPYEETSSIKFRPDYLMALEVLTAKARKEISLDDSDLQKCVQAYGIVAEWASLDATNELSQEGRGRAYVLAGPLLYEVLKVLDLQEFEVCLATCVFYKQVDHSWVAVRFWESSGESVRLDLDPAVYSNSICLLAARGATEDLTWKTVRSE